ncbi:O-Glycosyl hydrolases family 17 protein [Actinidia rufa]|uniref:O-Glycosyl hydrolases family 17 protein n=1 Tax=Actinidia rufa TaxID=165716 RepID=A0A7J0FL25_9ERIC|nr:O-Glycosyl hydrolases family 17 protein [Actinidia rufa]
MGLLTLLLLCFSLLLSLSSGEISQTLGLCYGQLGNNLQPPSKSVQLIKALNAKRVKIYDANPKILEALKGTNLQVSIMVPNQLLANISKNQTLADEWVRSNVAPFISTVKIRYLLVGNEILSSSDEVTHNSLVPAMHRIRASVKALGFKKIKIGTPLAMDVLESSFPPSNGTFRADFTGRIMKPLLQFLNRTKIVLLPGCVPVFLVGLRPAETGWPNGGDVDQIGANIFNSATFNRNIIKKLAAKPAVGTPARPGTALPALIFALYNENQKTGQGTERHFGLLYPNGSNIYPIDLSGNTPPSEYEPLPKPTNNEPYKGKIWCVVAEDANRTDLVSALGYACGQGNGTCDPIRPGGKCYRPNSLVRQASYAFSSYWAQFRKVGGTCYFNGLAVQTAKDPSK